MSIDANEIPDMPDDVPDEVDDIDFPDDVTDAPDEPEDTDFPEWVDDETDFVCESCGAGIILVQCEHEWSESRSDNFPICYYCNDIAAF